MSLIDGAYYWIWTGGGDHWEPARYMAPDEEDRRDGSGGTFFTTSYKGMEMEGFVRVGPRIEPPPDD